jgi:type VI protein secretion system component Hcp
MSQRFPVILVAVATAVSLFFSAEFASAEERGFLTIKGQKEGVIQGDVTESAYKDQIRLVSFSVSPATPGAGPTTISMTVNYKVLPLIFNALVTNEVITKTTITTDKPNTEGKRVKDSIIEVLNAYVTDLSFDLSTGGEPNFNFSLTTMASGSAIHYVDAKTGGPLSTAIPSLVAPTTPVHSSNVLKGRQTENVGRWRAHDGDSRGGLARHGTGRRCGQTHVVDAYVHARARCIERRAESSRSARRQSWRNEHRLLDGERSWNR